MATGGEAAGNSAAGAGAAGAGAAGDRAAGAGADRDRTEMRGQDLAYLVKACLDQNEEAWQELVSRFADLVTFVIRRYRMSPADTQDVSQVVWLRLVEHLARIREPTALPGWLTTATRHECERCLRVNGRSVAMDPRIIREAAPAGAGADSSPPGVDELLLAAERRRALLDGLAELAPQQRELLVMLTADPPYSYAEISAALDIPVGSIGPTRGRVLAKLRETDALRAYLGAEGSTQPRGWP